MFPRSKPLLALLVAVPLALVVAMWPLAQKRPRLVFTLGAPAATLALSHDGSALGIQSQNGGVSVWSRDTGRRLGMQSENGAVFSVSASSPSELLFSPDDQTLFASNVPVFKGGTGLYAWDVRTRQIKWSGVSNQKDDLSRYWPASDGKLVAQRSSNVVEVLDISGGGTSQKSQWSKFAQSFPIVTRFVPRIPAPKGGLTIPQTLALSPDGKTLAFAASDGHLEFWDVATGQKQFQTPSSRLSLPGLPSSGDWKLRYSPDGRFVAFFQGVQLSVWNLAGQKWTATTVSATGSETSLAWMPDSRSLWTGSGSVQQWSAPNLKLLRELPMGGPVAVSGDGQMLATRSIPSNGGSHGVWLWNIG